MRKFTLVILCFLLLVSCNLDRKTQVIIETEYGDMTLELYDSTPLHKENFIKLVKQGFYDELLFHRVISSFMIQGGDPDSKNANKNKRLGVGGPGYQIDAELGEYHFRGALAAARNNNPQKKSSGSQFYIVLGSPVTAQVLDRVEKTKGITYDEASKQRYIQESGTPNLDQEYSVFGMLVDGFDVLDKIGTVKTGAANRPVEDVKMKIRLK